MLKLISQSPITGTYYEHTYEEVVPVTDGVCFVQNESTRAALLQRGFIDAPVDEPVLPPAGQKSKWKTKEVETV